MSIYESYESDEELKELRNRIFEVEHEVKRKELIGDQLKNELKEVQIKNELKEVQRRLSGKVKIIMHEEMGVC